MCYNGPSFTLGENDNETKCKSDYANAIKLLNDASVLYKNGTYGYITRHLESDPSNPGSYETIITSYVKYYSNYNTSTEKPTTNLECLEQYHYKIDLNAVKLFSDTAEGKKIAGMSWLASRSVLAKSSILYFTVCKVYSHGSLFREYGMYIARPYGHERGISLSSALAPVVSLESK